MVEPDWPHVTIWRLHVSCWITKATNTHSEYVILIDFPMKKWLNERASVLHQHCLVIMEMGCVLCAVRTESIFLVHVKLSL